MLPITPSNNPVPFIKTCLRRQAHKALLEELRLGAMELSWAVRIADEIVAGAAPSKYAKRKEAVASLEERTALLRTLHGCLASYSLFNQALRQGDLEACLKILRERPKIAASLNATLQEDLQACQQALLTALEAAEWNLTDFRDAIIHTKLNPRIKKALCSLPEPVITGDFQEFGRQAAFVTDPSQGVLAKTNQGRAPSGKGQRQLIWDARAFNLAILELDNMVGLEVVKTKVRTYANLVKACYARQLHGDDPHWPSMNFVFRGNPGTGKTTVARCLGRILKAAGVLEKGHLVEVDRSGLISGYVGQSEAKTDKVIESALGGVLFIDEAYSLTSGHQEDFGRRSLEVLLKRMEDYRGEIAVIVAGYPQLMDKFLGSNPGLNGRFSERIDFPDYTPTELTIIYARMLGDMRFNLEPAVLAKVNYLFAQPRTEPFNGRDARNLADKTMQHQANRLAEQEDLSKEALYSIKAEDVPDELLPGLARIPTNLSTVTWIVTEQDGSRREVDYLSAANLLAESVVNTSTHVLYQIAPKQEKQG